MDKKHNYPLYLQFHYLSLSLEVFLFLKKPFK